MNVKEVISLAMGVAGFLILRAIYLGDAILSSNGQDIRWLAFGFGLILFFLFAFFMGQENRW
jgi:hypothetical protein